MGNQRTMFILGPVHTQATAKERPVLSWNQPLSRKGLIICPERMKFGAGVPVHPTKTPGGTQVESEFQLHNI